MPQCTKQVCNQIRSRSDISGALAASWGRLINKIGRGTLADKLDISTTTIKRAIGGDNLPALETALNALALDATALDEVLALYGYQLCPIDCAPCEDGQTRARLAHILSEWLALGERADHRAKCRLADEMRAVIPAMMALIVQADNLRRAA